MEIIRCFLDENKLKQFFNLESAALNFNIIIMLFSKPNTKLEIWEIVINQNI
jgi:hypothetical protein